MSYERFRVMYLNEYDFSQFYEISVKKLLSEGLGEYAADEIAKSVWEQLPNPNIRNCVQIGAVCCRNIRATNSSYVWICTWTDDGVQEGLNKHTVIYLYRKSPLDMHFPVNTGIKDANNSNPGTYP